MKKVFLLFAMGLSGLCASAADLMNADYIDQWGALTVKGRQLSSTKTGGAVQLKGWSSFGNYNENCVTNKDDLNRMKGMGANCVRIAKYFDTSYGEFSDDQVIKFIDWAAEVGIYCIADWHILEKSNNKRTGNPNMYTNEAKQFFGKISAHVASKGYKHVIYELCNEPSGCSAAQIKEYAENVIPTITANDKNEPIVIVGTPNWDQYIMTETYNNGALVSYKNAMYAFHMYANEGNHKSLMENQFLPATSVMPVFVSEWGMSSAEPELVHGDIWKDVNEAVSNKFISYCNGEGSGQIVSWMNWSYGNKPEGSSTFRTACAPGDNGANLSPSGQWIVGVLGGEINPSVPKGACYGSECFQLSKSSEEAQLNLKNYDQNPEAKDGELGGSADVTYYDANNTPDENYDEKSTALYDPYKKVSTTEHDPTGSMKGEVIQCYAGRAWCAVRTDECVDLTDAEIDGKWGTATGLSWVSSGEWVNYTFDVADAGYYSLEVAVGKSNTGYGKTTMAEDGSLTYTAKASFAMSLVDHASQTFMVDIDASSATEEKAIAKSEFAPYNDMGFEPVDANDRHFVPCGTGAAGNTKANHGILFKEAGKHTVRLSFPFGFNGQMGALRFTYAKPWTGEGYPEEVKDPGTGVEDAIAAGVSVYPTVVENGVFNVVAEGEANVIVTNMAGSVVYSASVEGNAAINANLAAGVYNVKVVSANEVATAKIIVK